MSGDTSTNSQKEQQLFNWALQTGLLNERLFDRINHILDARNKSEALQDAINNVMSKIQELMIEGGNTPDNRLALRIASGKLEDLVNVAGSLNASGISPEINTGGVRETLNDISRIESSNSRTANSGGLAGDGSSRNNSGGDDVGDKQRGRKTDKADQSKRDQFEKAMEGAPDGASPANKSSTDSAPIAKDNSTTPLENAQQPIASPVAAKSTAAAPASSLQERMRLALLNVPDADTDRSVSTTRGGQTLRVANAKAVVDSEYPNDGGSTHVAQVRVKPAAHTPS